MWERLVGVPSEEIAEIIEGVIEATYGALYKPELWKTVVELYCQTVGGRQCALHSAPRAGDYGSMFLTHGVDPTPVLPVIHVYGRQAPFMDRALRMGIVPGVFLNQDVFPYEELWGTDYYLNYMKPMDVEHGITAVLRAGVRNEIAPIALAAGRGRCDEPFGEREAAITRAVFPHLRRAVTLRLEVDPMRMLDPAMTDALDRFETACCLLGHSGEVLHANASARTLFLDGRGVGFKGGRLRATSGSADRALQQAIRQVCDPAALWALRSPSEILASDGSEPLILKVTPLGHDNPFLSVGPVRAAVYLLDARMPVTAEGSGERLRTIFALTKAEAEVTSQLLSGATVQEVAARRGASVHTVRIQLRSVLEKTQSSRQADLFRLAKLMTLPL